jgi:hypothetical protein
MTATLISTMYAAFITRITGLLTTANGWTRIPNPYDLQGASNLMLNQGWGVKLGEGVNRGFVTCNMMIDRTFRVVISRMVFKTEHDADGLASVELQLMEDLRTIVHDFETTVMLNNGQGFCTYNNDSGISLVGGEEQFLTVEASFTVKLIENYNS